MPDVDPRDSIAHVKLSHLTSWHVACRETVAMCLTGAQLVWLCRMLAELVAMCLDPGAARVTS
eukprot:2319614-Rhodomonas_salina.1